MNPSHLVPPPQPGARRHVPGSNDQPVLPRSRPVRDDASDSSLDEALIAAAEPAAEASSTVTAPDIAAAAAAAATVDPASTEAAASGSSGGNAAIASRAATDTLIDLPIGLLGVSALGAGAAVAASGGGSSRSTPPDSSPLPSAGANPGGGSVPGFPNTPAPAPAPAPTPPTGSDSSSPSPTEPTPGTPQPTPDPQPTPENPAPGPRPNALTASLVNDTGASATDKITNDGTLAIAGVIDGAKWQYSLDGGASWTTGEGDRLASSALGSDGVKTVMLRQLDGRSVASEASIFSFELDTTRPQALQGLLQVKLTPEGKADTTVSWGNLEAGGYWQYSYDGSSNSSWSSPIKETKGEFVFNAQVLEHRQIDLAGNASLTGASHLTGLFTSGNSSEAGVLTQGGSISTTHEFGSSGTYSLDNGITWKSFEANSNANIWVIPESQIDGSNGARTIQIRADDTTISYDFILDRDNLRPDLALKNDSGESKTDRITNDGTILVSGLQADTTWKFSVDGGTTWKAGGADHQISTTEFGKSDGLKSVQVIQTSASGVDSAVQSFEFERVTSTVTGVHVTVQENASYATYKFEGDGGANRFVVGKETLPTRLWYGSALNFTGFDPAEGDVVDLSQVLSIQPGTPQSDYIVRERGDLLFFLNGGGFSMSQDLTIRGLPIGNGNVELVYDGGSFII